MKSTSPCSADNQLDELNFWPWSMRKREPQLELWRALTIPSGCVFAVLTGMAGSFVTSQTTYSDASDQAVQSMASCWSTISMSSPRERNGHFLFVQMGLAGTGAPLCQMSPSRQRLVGVVVQRGAASRRRWAVRAGSLPMSWLARHRLGSSWTTSVIYNATARGRLGKAAGCASIAFSSMGYSASG